VAGTIYCDFFEALEVGGQNSGYYCNQADSEAAAQAQATEGDCAAFSIYAGNPACTFVSAYAGSGAGGLVNPDTGDPDCPEHWAQLVTCCYVCEENPLP
jgi:hypothetical protein